MSETNTDAFTRFGKKYLLALAILFATFHAVDLLAPYLQYGVVAIHVCASLYLFWLTAIREARMSKWAVACAMLVTLDCIFGAIFQSTALTVEICGRLTATLERIVGVVDGLSQPIQDVVIDRDRIVLMAIYMLAAALGGVAVVLAIITRIEQGAPSQTEVVK